MGKLHKYFQPLTKATHLKVKGGALYLAIFISFIITLLTGFYILHNYYNRCFLDIVDQRQQFQDNANSGLTLLLNEYQDFRGKKRITLDLYGQGNDMVSLSTKSWGAYHICVSTAGNENYSFSRGALIGARIDSIDKVGLYLADQGGYLSVCGNTYLSGSTYLPALGIRKAIIEGQSFQREKITENPPMVSESRLPPIPESLFKENYQYLLGHPEKEDSIIEFEKVAGMDTIVNSFKQNTLVLFSKTDIILNKIVLKGNIRILSPASILITSLARPDGIILYAKNIYIASGLSGNLQAFAKDTLWVGKDCRLDFPSVVAVMDSSTRSKYLHLMTGTRIEGMVLLDQQGLIFEKSLLEIDNGVEITGQVWWKGLVQMKGTIRGSLYCQSFVLKTESVFYDNHLFSAVISGDEMPLNYLGLSFRNTSPVNGVIRWIQ